MKMEPAIIKADYCECGKPNVQVFEQNHICWCRCLNCGREGEYADDDFDQAVMNWVDEKFQPEGFDTMMTAFRVPFDEAFKTVNQITVIEVKPKQ